MMLNYPNTTETMEERAWRYGENGVTHWKTGASWLAYFSDGSVMTPSGVLTRHDRYRQMRTVCLADDAP